MDSRALGGESALGSGSRCFRAMYSKQTIRVRGAALPINASFAETARWKRCTQVACKNLTATRLRIEDRESHPISLFDPRSSIFISSLHRYPHIVNARLDEACAAGVRRLDQDSDCLSGELAEVHRGGGEARVVVSSGAQFLKYRGHRSADHNPHAEEVGARGIVQVRKVI